MLGQEHAPSVARKCKNKFRSQVLNAWGKLLCKVKDKNINTVLCSSLWYNPAITKAQLYLPHWYEKGILTVGDVMYKNSAYISQNKLQKIYSIKTIFLDYHRVVTCVSGLLTKLNLKYSENVKPNYPNNLSLLLKSRKGSRDFYRTLTDIDSQNRPTSSFWEKKFQDNHFMFRLE